MKEIRPELSQLVFKVLLPRNGNTIILVQREHHGWNSVHRRRLVALRDDRREKDILDLPLLEMSNKPVEYPRHAIMAGAHRSGKVRNAWTVSIRAELQVLRRDFP